MSEIYLDFIIVPPIYLEVTIADCLMIVPVNGEAPSLQIAIDQYFTEGIRQTGVDAGIFKQISFTDDYTYYCVRGGAAGQAIWKKTILFQT